MGIFIRRRNTIRERIISFLKRDSNSTGTMLLHKCKSYKLRARLSLIFALGMIACLCVSCGLILCDIMIASSDDHGHQILRTWTGILVIVKSMLMFLDAFLKAILDETNDIFDPNVKEKKEVEMFPEVFLTLIAKVYALIAVGLFILGVFLLTGTEVPSIVFYLYLLSAPF